MDLSTPEKAIITLEEFYTNQDLDGVFSCKNFEKEAENMLIESKHEVTSELRSELAELLKLSLIQDLQTYGFPYFTNIERQFSVLSIKNDSEKLIEVKIIFASGKVSINKFWTFKEDSGQWKVLNRVE